MDDEVYKFDPVAADNAVRFLSAMPHVVGAKAGQPFGPEPWQVKFMRELFGWRRQDDNTRKYRIAFVEIPRKNGKTVLAAAIGLYLLVADGEVGANVYGAAKTRDQAALAYDMAVEMIRRTPWLAKRCRIYKSPKRIYVEETNSAYFPIAADDGAAHGLNAHGILFDELHAQTNRRLWDTLQTSRGARRQPLTIAITTAGNDRSSICWEQYQYAIAVRDGVIDDPTFLPLIYAAGDDDDWTDEATWERANPNLDVSISREFLRTECEKAKRSPAYENTFRNLYLNQWTQQEVRWIPMREWDACEQEVDWTSFEGEPCYVGFDLGSTRDLSGIAAVFPRDDRYYVRVWTFSPESAPDKRAEADKRMIDNWRAQGLIVSLSGDTLDFHELAEWYQDFAARHLVQRVLFDPLNHSAAFVQVLEKLGADTSIFEKFAQTIMNYAPVCRELERILGTKQLVHDGDPVLRWMAGNVAPKTDASGNVRPDKGKSADKIDGIVAMLMGLWAAVGGSGATISDSVCWVPGDE